MSAVYATDRKDLAIVMAMFACPEVTGGSIDEYQEEKLTATIHGRYPKQEYLYLHHLPEDSFTQTQIDKYQFVSETPVKPIRTEKINTKENHHLARLATPQETQKWLEKYG